MRRWTIGIACSSFMVISAQQVFALGIGECVGGLDPFTGHAVGLDGINDYVRAPDNPPLDVGQQLTLEAWFFGYPGSGMKTILGKGDGELCESDRAFDIEYVPTEGSVHANLFLGPIGSCNWVACYSPIGSTPPLTWVHFAVVLDTAAPVPVCRVFVNGILTGETNEVAQGAPMPALPVRNSTRPFTIGATPPYLYFNGAIDEVRFWNVARTQSQIQANFHQTLRGNQPGLVGYWKFDDGIGATAYDGMGNADGTLLNGAYWVPTSAGPDCNGNNRPDACDIADGVSNDLNGNGIPDECDCPADPTRDGVVNIDDLVVIITLWGHPDLLGGLGDLNHDGLVNIDDLVMVITNWGSCF